MKDIEFIHPELWSIYGAISFALILVFRVIVFRTSFLGRALVCFSTGFALFFILVAYDFSNLIGISTVAGTGTSGIHMASDGEIKRTFYIWFMPALALALGSSINVIWLLREKYFNRFIEGKQQLRILSISLAIGMALVMLLGLIFMD